MALFFEDYEALPIGHSWRSGKRAVTTEDIGSFASLTGDTHPQHIDADYGKASSYGSVIAHGFLTISLASGLVYRMGFDETAAHAILGMTWRLTNAVFPGDELHVVLTLTGRRASNKYPELGIVERRYDVKNQNDQIVAVGELSMLIKRART